MEKRRNRCATMVSATSIKLEEYKMTTQKNDLTERLIENYIMGRISRKQFDAMIEVAKCRNTPLSDNAKNPN